MSGQHRPCGVPLLQGKIEYLVEFWALADYLPEDKLTESQDSRGFSKIALRAAAQPTLGESWFVASPMPPAYACEAIPYLDC
jgi:hypothetical protein